MESWPPLARGVGSPPLEPIMVSLLSPVQPNTAPPEPGGREESQHSYLPEGAPGQPLLPIATMGFDFSIHFGLSLLNISVSNSCVVWCRVYVLDLESPGFLPCCVTLGKTLPEPQFPHL